MKEAVISVLINKEMISSLTPAEVTSIASAIEKNNVADLNEDLQRIAGVVEDELMWAHWCEQEEARRDYEESRLERWDWK